MMEVKNRLNQIEITSSPIALIALDFDNFNYINDLYGYKIGDRVLDHISNHFDSVLQDNDIFCRMHADHFLICLQTGSTALASQKFTKLTELRQVLAEFLPPHYILVASGGIFIVQDNKVPLSGLLDRANCARKLSKGTAVNTFHIYDQKMDEEAQWKKQVTCMMEIALSNREFEMYLQPKVLFKSGEIIGAEALVRWNNPVYGLVYPDRFIPILEQNGFIQRLDFFMLEEACRFLHEHKQKGYPILPISVNFSKSHLRSEKLVERIFEMVNSQGISTHLIEIEFTENTLSENTERLLEIVSDLKLLGFRIAIDDFGSAYSSLNYLKDLPVDIIKIDKGFLNSSAGTNLGKIVIAKVVELVKSLRMVAVMEGVETEDQANFLKKLSCDIGQGYFYAKPMPKADYLNYLKKGIPLKESPTYTKDSKIEKESNSYLYDIPQEFQMDNWDLYTLGKNIDMGLMKGYLDGEATVQYVNERALEYLGYTRQEFRQILHNNITAFTHPDDREIVKANTEQLILTGQALQFQIRAIRKDGKIILLQGRSSCVLDNQGRPIGIYAFQDVTQEVEKTTLLQQALENKIKELQETITSEQLSQEELRLSEERYRIVVEQSDNIMFEWDFESDTILFSNKYKTLFGRNPRGTINVTTNPNSRNFIHPEDLNVFETWLYATYRKPGCVESAFRIEDLQGRYLWMACRSTAICNQKNIPVKAVGVLTNIQEQKELVDELKQKAQLDPLTKLLNKAESQHQIDHFLQNEPREPGVLFMIDIDNFKDINDNLGHQLGDTVLKQISSSIKSIFPETNMIGRIGGDEFVVYLPHTNDQLTYNKAEHLTQILHLSYFGSVSKYEISGSIGIARYPEHGNTFHDLYRYADIALYNAKKSGKNQFIIYNDSIVSNLMDNRTPVEYSSNFLNTYFQNDITFQVFGMLYETKDVSVTIPMILELLGEKFGEDRVYIFEKEGNKKYLRNTYEWCAPGITPEIENLQQLPLKMFEPYFKEYSAEGVFCCEDIRKASPVVYETCEPQGIKSLLHCAIYDAGKIVGFIGFDFCREYHSWTGEEIALLGYISRILSVFMIKKVKTDQLKTSYQNYAEIVENLNGFVYVIDPKTFEVLFVNRSMREIGLAPGKLCYAMAYGAEKQCDNCPIRKMGPTIHSASSEVYSEILKTFVNAAASNMKWEGNRDTILVCCTDNSRYK